VFPPPLPTRETCSDCTAMSAPRTPCINFRSTSPIPPESMRPGVMSRDALSPTGDHADRGGRLADPPRTWSGCRSRPTSRPTPTPGQHHPDRHPCRCRRRGQRRCGSAADDNDVGADPENPTRPGHRTEGDHGLLRTGVRCNIRQCFQPHAAPEPVTQPTVNVYPQPPQIYSTA
jgi:hypothetical protein